MDVFEKNLKDVIFSEAKDVIFQKQNIPCVQSVWNHKFRVFALFRSWKSGKFLRAPWKEQTLTHFVRGSFVLMVFRFTRTSKT